MTVDGGGAVGEDEAGDDRRRRLLDRWKRGEIAEEDAPTIGRRPAGCRVPASASQERFWVVDRLFPDQAVNNLAYQVDIAGALDIDAVGRSLREVVRRHEALRLCLRLDREGLTQVFADALDVTVPVVDLADQGSAAGSAAEALAMKLAGEPFDVTTTPLFRAALARTAPDRHALILVVHHAAFDGWSSGIFLQELVALYKAYAEGTEPVLPPPVQYGDVAVWQEAQTDPDRVARGLAHWHEQLGDYPGPLDLPVDFERGASPRVDGRVIRLALPETDTAALRALAAEGSATFFMALLALYELALHRFTGQRDFTVGSPIANRGRAELRHVVGPLINLLVFRSDLDGDPSFRELLGRVRERVRAGFAHQDVPFQALVERLGGRRGSRSAPLFQVVLALQNFPSVDPLIGGLVGEPRLVETGVTHADIALFAYPGRSGELDLLCEYDSELFREATVRHLLDDLVHLGAVVATSPDVPLSQLSGQATPGRRRRDVLDHWRRRLATTSGPLDLPGPTGSPASATESSSPALDVAPVVVDRLRAQGVPLSDGVLAAFATLLSRYCHQDAVVIGVRPDDWLEPGPEAAVDGTADVLPLVVEVDGARSFHDLADAVGHEVRDALARQAIPVDELAAELGWGREPDRHPLCRALFVVESAADGSGHVEDVDLVLRLVEGDGKVQVGVDVRRDLVDDWVADGLARSLVQLLDGLSAGPEQPIASVATVTPAEEAALLRPGDVTPALDPDACLHTLFEDQVSRQPDALAVVWGDQRFTYGEMNAWSNRIAHGLLDSGARPGDTVALRLPGGAPAVAHMLGVLKAGMAFAFLDPAWPSDYEQRALALLRPSVVVDEDRSGDQPTTDPEAVVDPDQLAYVAFTSGSTGPPKAIPHPHRNLAQFVLWQGRALAIDATQRLGQLAAPTFDVAYCEVFGALCCGATLAIPPGAARADPAALGRWLRDDRVTVVQIIPRLFRLVWRALELDGAVEASLAALRCVAFVGEALPRATVAAIREGLGDRVRLVNIYGPTEVVAATFHTVDDVAEGQATVAIGRPLDGRRIVLVDRIGAVCPPGALGEIWIGGDHLTPGYLGGDTAASARFVTRDLPEGPVRFYRTGDMARLGPDGLLTFHGREDHQVKLHGVRLELDAIEAAAVASGATEDCAAVVHEVQGVQRLVLYLVPADGSVSSVDLRALLRRTLPSAMVPSEVVAVPALPRTATGKIDRRALPGLAVDLRPPTERLAPRTASESTLAAIVREVLGLEEVGVLDDFFELGGNSLQAAQIANRIREAFAVELPLLDFFDEPTIAATAAALDAATAHAIDHRRAQIVDQVERLSDEEVAALLSEHRATR